MQARGTFELTAHPEPPFLEADGVSLGRARFEKRFSGALSAESEVHMLSARTPVKGSAAYVAVERISGTLDGRRGSFVVAHLGTMGGGEQSLTIPIVPDSGTGELAGIRGSMHIDIVDGQHHYTIDWTL
jgi:hypothetical protein